MEHPHEKPVNSPARHLFGAHPAALRQNDCLVSVGSVYVEMTHSRPGENELLWDTSARVNSACGGNVKVAIRKPNYAPGNAHE